MGSGNRSGLWEEISVEGTGKFGKKGKRKRGGGATVTREDEDSMLEGDGLSQEDKKKRSAGASFTQEVLDLVTAGALSKATQLALSDGVHLNPSIMEKLQELD